MERKRGRDGREREGGTEWRERGVGDRGLEREGEIEEGERAGDRGRDKERGGGGGSGEDKLHKSDLHSSGAV